jgi:hypothetical protein
MDYAAKRGVSLSTLRRHIKASKILYKVENGRYLVFDDSEDFVATNLNPSLGSASKTSTDTAKLQHDLQRAREEIAELKMLVALYEEKPPTQRQ